MIRYGSDSAGRVFLKNEGIIANNMFKITIQDKSITNTYLYTYLSQEEIYKKIHNNQNGGMPAVNFKQISSILIPIPPIEEQERIVSILDKFDALVNDISIGLPAEINARRQQYEYYRDKLLTFEEAA